MKRTAFARKPAEGRHAARSKPLARAGQLARTAGLKARSPKMAKAYRTKRVPLVAAMLAEQPWCQIQWDEGCQGRSADIHELLSRGRGGSITAEANCIAGCRHCHDAVTQNPAEAEARGFALPSGRPSKATPRHAAVTRG